MLSKILKRQRGFTLIELLAVIAIMTVLAGIVAGAVTGIGASGQSARLQGDRDTLGKAADRFFNDAFPQSYPVLTCCGAGTGTPVDITTAAGDLKVRLIDFEAVLPGDPTRSFVPGFLKEVPATAGLVSWRVVTTTGQVFFTQDGAQLILPSTNRLDGSAASAIASAPSALVTPNYTFKLRMKKNEAALKILEIQIPAGYSIGGQSVAAGSLMGTLTGAILTDNPWAAGVVQPLSGLLLATGFSNQWKLSVDYSTAVNTTVGPVTGRPDRAFSGSPGTPDTRHAVNLVEPSLEAAGSIKFLLNTNGDQAHNQAGEEWTLTICGIAGAPAATACPATGTPAVITNPTAKAVYRWLAREQTSIDVADTFNDVTGNQAVVIKESTATAIPASTPVTAAVGTSFLPTTLVLATTGAFATVTVSTVGVALGADGVQLNIQHSSLVTVTSPTCVGIFSAANVVGPTTASGGTLMGCTLLSGNVSGTTGNVMTFVVTRVSAGTPLLTFGLGGLFGTTFSDGGIPIGPGATNTLQITN